MSQHFLRLSTRFTELRSKIVKSMICPMKLNHLLFFGLTGQLERSAIFGFVYLPPLQFGSVGSQFQEDVRNGSHCPRENETSQR